MIVDFIDIRTLLHKFAFRHLTDVRRSNASFLNLINKYTIHEGDKATYQTVDNETVNLEMKKLESVLEVSSEIAGHMKYEEVLEHFEKIAQDIVLKEHEHAINRINETVEEGGNVIDATGKTYIEATLEALESIPVDFDETRDRPRLPSMILSPEKIVELQQYQANLTKQEVLEHERRRQEILDRKYKEYLLRESNRKLAD